MFDRYSGKNLRNNLIMQCKHGGQVVTTECESSVLIWYAKDVPWAAAWNQSSQGKYGAQ